MVDALNAFPLHAATVRTVPISTIKVGDRHRKDMGDIKGLAASI